MLLGKIKIYDIAKELNMSSKDLVEIAIKLNIDVKSHLSAISEEDAERIKAKVRSTGGSNNQNNNKKRRIKMTSIAITMMIVALLVIWGGLIFSLIRLPKEEK